MVHFATLVIALCAFFAFVAASPVANLETRTTNTGTGTWYEVGLGACGSTDADSDYVVAISHDIYGSGDNCNQYMRIENTANGQVAYGQTRDKCMGCESTAIDMSPSLFQALGASLDDGTVTVSWNFMSKDYSP
ncbi:RlpA-like double-psi beta-barrel-protein domain-containing protein-containing protein [Rhodofomes roseus]|uniref:RlpA-like double-psi beta-barrel-protein domain-containing protein-containing protein n=1 Tax=Rhodofomes roseus TaxID=34475 RepID=A0A4Y9YZD0_9APHY|nr:RlpA-like double-psi beta-barrel-protein domain-containing protein-containing protein [Rhodofomes roseus]KAH9835189.1 RlpA-like double-psi beta-barrel-protein domain-containing protein-containing protein [Rhodofomes roseus]TFY67117.1 hypothetical protein EVJ58_g1838 [Rhodofomes roseus]